MRKTTDSVFEQFCDKKILPDFEFHFSSALTNQIFSSFLIGIVLALGVLRREGE